MINMKSTDKEMRALFSEIGREYRRHFSNLEKTKVLANKNDGDVTREFDREIETKVIERLKKMKLPIRIVSEECGEVILNKDYQYIGYLDPLDGSDMAARGYPLCSSAISIAEKDTGQPVYSIIQEIAFGTQYVSYGNKSYRNGIEVRVSKPAPIDEAFIVSYMPKKHRLAKINELDNLFQATGLFLNYGGPLDIAKVGSNQVDVFIEFVKGFKAIDFLSGAHFATNAGACLVDLQGNPILPNINSGERKKFICARSPELAERVIELINQN